MARYVTSLNRTATTSHLGEAHELLCRYVIRSAFTVTDTMPEGRTLCGKCAVVLGRAERAAMTAEQIAAEKVARREQYVAIADAAVVAVLKTGADTNVAVGRALGIGRRQVVRRLADAMHRAGARSRFEWGYIVGRNEERLRLRGE